MKLLLTIMISGWLLAGCVGQTAQPTTYYQLPTIADSQQSSDGPLLIIAPIKLSDMLLHPGIVLQTDAVTLHVARQHLWAGDLPQQLQTALQQRLQAALPQYQVRTAGIVADHATTLSLQIHAFQGHYQGVALLRGQWQLRTPSGSTRSAVISIQNPLPDDGYPALVNALADTLDSLAADLAKSVNSLPKN
ncbi:putative lipoprotein [Methylophaga frappieri]|uniref:Putative lipoprotein n=1 Tax=Methylophaga frappieri (strain ATCC BAA-2434 / DSM 25690 / JAM7) TaxID=754477 RepID=I1YFZ0_METFJ|nr:ABC-type transport auxiliary lipoprotein family protein [Methylophaga frappieri]AFJ01833.1 putative lipoprotein [Methylophaga frappieri]